LIEHISLYDITHMFEYTQINTSFVFLLTHLIIQIRKKMFLVKHILTQQISSGGRQMNVEWMFSCCRVVIGVFIHKHTTKFHKSHCT